MPDEGAAAPGGSVAASRAGLGPLVAVLGLVLVAVVGIVATVVLTRTGDDPETRTYVVAAGTASRLDAGEEIDLMPAEVRLDVGDTLVIRNEDERDYVIGPYFVRSGETLRQTYTRPQELSGACELSGHGEIRVVVG